MRTQSSSTPATLPKFLPKGSAASLPIPFGWYALACGADLAPGDVRPLYYFDEHLVLFRTEDGQAHVTAAFCPHLGAHLGYGGRVEGNAIVCPFHGWRFDGEGVCVNVPYARAIPRRAANGPCLYSYPVVERNRMIWAWHHPRHEPPLFELDDVPELTDPEWCEPTRYEWEVNAPIQESGENAVDVAHFVAVHGARDVPDAKITLAGHRRDTDLTALAPAIDSNGNVDFSRLETIHLITRSCGPGMSVQIFDLGARTVMLGTVTPITPTRMKLCFNFTKRLDTPARLRPLVDGLIAEIVRQVEQDIPIWEHKMFREAPILCDGDGPIAKYRRWFSQFYDTADPQIASRPLSREQISLPWNKRLGGASATWDGCCMDDERGRATGGAEGAGCGALVFDKVRRLFRYPTWARPGAMIAALSEMSGLMPRYAWLRPDTTEASAGGASPTTGAQGNRQALPRRWQRTSMQKQAPVGHQAERH